MESAKLLSQGALQMVKFGPLLNARVGYYSLAALPQGLVAAGAACSATTVDNDDAQGQAKITAILVRLGFVNFVRDIVVRLCEAEERSDVVAAITAALLQLKEIDIVRQINDALVLNGHVATGAKIAGSMVTQGYTEMGEIAAQQVTESGKEGGILHSLKEQGTKVMDAFSTEEQKQQRQQQQEQQAQEEEAERAAEKAAKEPPSLLGSMQQSASEMLNSFSTSSSGKQQTEQQAPARVL